MKGLSANMQRFWDRVGTRLKASFYLYLAALFTVVIIADSFVFNVTAKMRQSSFDLMIKNRLVVRPPDPDIVIVDINEASLAAMAVDYGRWPWPRQVMGEFLEQVEGQRPRAVVFDILFSDPDVYNPDSDAYFNEAVAATDNTFCPYLRLDPKDDRLSEVLPGQIPGVQPAPCQTGSGSPVAVVLPFFEAGMTSGRLGTHNIYPDMDGVTRKYTVRRDEGGWLFPSLPARVVEWLGVPVPEREDVLLNWRGKPFTYHYVSFSDVFFDLGRKERTRSQDEFTGKIVIIGSTAAGLFDVKPTPMDRMFPGVEILATATDNLKNGDYLREPDMRLVNFALALLIVWATAFAFYRNAGQETLDRLFGASQFLLIGVSYASINLMTAYVNLTGPVMIGVAYFSAARIYASAARKILEESAVASSVASEGHLYAALILVRPGAGQDAAGDKAVSRMRRGLAKRLTQARSVETLKGAQKGIWGLFEGVIVVSWTCPADDEAARARITDEAKAVEEEATRLWLAAGGRADALTFSFHESGIHGGDRAREGWASLFGDALKHTRGPGGTCGKGGRT
ncbi:MAG: CHASE2 domain-containing protein [Nitrospirae bacterium]|nr:CHASE2 domain-containing protein [Nitrospirota bacterium]